MNHLVYFYECILNCPLNTQISCEKTADHTSYCNTVQWIEDLHPCVTADVQLSELYSDITYYANTAADANAKPLSRDTWLLGRHM